MQRENIGFTEDESKKQDSTTTFEGGHSYNDLSEYEEGHFLAGQGSIWKNILALSP